MSWSGAAMALLAMVSVGLWTLRVALAASGRRLAAATVAALESVVFALAFSNLIGHLGAWQRIAGYAIGVAIGTVGGLVFNDRMDRGPAVVEMVVPGDGNDLRDTLHARGWPATTMPARGVSGQATVVFLVVRANRTREVLQVVRTAAPGALWMVRRAATARGAPGMATAVTV